MLKSSSGLEHELHLSRDFHGVGIPLLISPQLLRLRDLGQIDLARLKKQKGEWVIEIGEVKSSNIGVESMERSQKGRLYSAGRFLSGLFGFPSKLISMVGQDSQK